MQRVEIMPESPDEPCAHGSRTGPFEEGCSGPAVMRVDDVALCYTHATAAMYGNEWEFVIPDDPVAAALSREISAVARRNNRAS